MVGERGQTAAEYLGMIVVIAAIIGALATTDVGAAVKREVTSVVCRIAGGECEPETPTVELPSGGGGRSVPASTTTEPGGGGGESDYPPGWPTDGPSLEDAPEDFPILPFPGSVGGGADGAVGVGTDYTVTTTPDRADAYENDDAELPNPLDPDSLAPGEGLELGESYYEKAGLSANYRALQASMGFEAGRRLSSGVSKIDDDTVRIYVGDAEYVKQSLGVGLGTDGIGVQFGGSSTESEGQLSAIDIDTSTKAGWEAYQAFAASGTLPKPGAAGTANPRTSDTFDLSEENSPGISIGGLDVGVQLGEADGHRTETHNPDGTTDYSISADRGSRGLQILDYGDPLKEDLYALNFEGVDDVGVDYYNQVNGSDLSEYDEGVRIEYTEDELQDIQDAAIDIYQDEAERQGLDVPSDEEVLEGFNYGEDPSDDVSDVNLATAPALIEPLLEAETPGDILLALEAGNGTGSASTALADIADLASATAAVRNQNSSEVQVLPGDSITPDCG